MNTQAQQILTELEHWGKQHDAQETEHHKKMLNLEPDTAQLLSILIQSGHRTHLLEIGTSNGYSTIWLAAAMQATGGHVTSLERSTEKQAMAETNLARAGLRDYVSLILGDAEESLRGMTGSYDFVFLDADRRQYPTLLPLLIPRLVPGALVLADNVHSHPQEIEGYLEAIGSDARFSSVTVGVGKGLSIAYAL